MQFFFAQLLEALEILHEQSCLGRRFIERIVIGVDWYGNVRASTDERRRLLELLHPCAFRARRVAQVLEVLQRVQLEQLCNVRDGAVLLESYEFHRS